MNSFKNLFFSLFALSLFVPSAFAVSPIQNLRLTPGSAGWDFVTPDSDEVELLRFDLRSMSKDIMFEEADFAIFIDENLDGTFGLGGEGNYTPSDIFSSIEFTSSTGRVYEALSGASLANYARFEFDRLLTPRSVNTFAVRADLLQNAPEVNVYVEILNPAQDLGGSGSITGDSVFLTGEASPNQKRSGIQIRVI